MSFGRFEVFGKSLKLVGHANAAFVRINKVDIGEKRLTGDFVGPIGGGVEGVGRNIEVKVRFAGPRDKVTGLAQKRGESGRGRNQLRAHVMSADGNWIPAGNQS